MLCSELCILFILVCCNDSSGRIHDSAKSVFIEEMNQILALSALCSIAWNQNICLGHKLTQYLAHFRISSTYNGTNIAVGITHSLFAPLGNLLTNPLIERSAVNETILEFAAAWIRSLY